MMGSYSSLSSGVKVWCGSDDFINDVIAIVPPGVTDVKEHFIGGDVKLGEMTGVGANSVIMPDNEIPEGTVIGALSYVPPRFPFEPWSVYAGIRVRLVGRRNRDSVVRQVEKLKAQLDLLRK
jgi:galactoside O-acetyltransferase